MQSWVKSVDFFLYDIPIDLKVTFFPNQFLNEKIKLALGKSELAWLKSESKSYGISVDSNLSNSMQIVIMKEKLKDRGLYSILEELNEVKKNIILESQKNSRELIVWLYSNQGEMRFGSENRLFLILADVSDLDQSWKMKRDMFSLKPKIEEYLDNFKKSKLKRIDFDFNKNKYKALSDTIFVIRNYHSLKL